MKYLFSLSLFFLLTSCQSQYKKNTEQFKKDSLADRKEKRVEEIIEESKNKILFDTLGVDVPIKVIKAEIVKKEYSNYREIQLTYKNVSSKKIEAIRFRWHVINSFGEPADGGGSFEKGFGQGVTDDAIAPGKTQSGIWDILSADAKRVTKAWAYEIVFSDGSKWKSTPN